MSKGKRYETERQLNYQKVLAVVIAIAVVIMFIFIIKNALKERKDTNKEYEYFTLYSANKWGVINQEGEIIQQPIYELKWNIPEFIGKYYRTNEGYGDAKYSDTYKE